MSASWHVNDRDRTVGSLAVRIVRLRGRHRVVVRPGHALLLMPLRGDPHVAVEGEGDAAAAPVFDAPALLLAHGVAALRLDAPDAACLVVECARERVNAVASARLGDGRRLARGVVSLDRAPALHALLRRLMLAGAGAVAGDGDALAAVEAEFYPVLVAALLDGSDGAARLQPMRAVSEAMQILRTRLDLPVDLEALATMVGVTPQTLRKGFRLCVGATVKEFAAAVRLDWARDRLAGGRETRPVAALAQQLGYASATHFSRSYVRRFGETPSQTRARTARMAA